MIEVNFYDHISDDLLGFKEIDLSEKQSTGIPQILRELKQNGSPMPVFETDPDRIYLITTIKIREGFEVSVDNFVQKIDRSLTEVLTKKNYEKAAELLSFRGF